MKALHSNVIFTRIEEQKKKSIIILAEEDKETYTYGTVVSVGNDCTVLKVKDTILIPRHADEFIIEGKHYLICKEEDISATF